MQPIFLCFPRFLIHALHGPRRLATMGLLFLGSGFFIIPTNVSCGFLFSLGSLFFLFLLFFLRFLLVFICCWCLCWIGCGFFLSLGFCCSWRFYIGAEELRPK